LSGPSAIDGMLISTVTFSSDDLLHSHCDSRSVRIAHPSHSSLSPSAVIKAFYLSASESDPSLLLAHRTALSRVPSILLLIVLLMTRLRPGLSFAQAASQPQPASIKETSADGWIHVNKPNDSISPPNKHAHAIPSSAFLSMSSYERAVMMLLGMIDNANDNLHSTSPLCYAEPAAETRLHTPTLMKDEVENESMSSSSSFSEWSRCSVSDADSDSCVSHDESDDSEEECKTPSFALPETIASAEAFLTAIDCSERDYDCDDERKQEDDEATLTETEAYGDGEAEYDDDYVLSTYSDLIDSYTSSASIHRPSSSSRHRHTLTRRAHRLLNGKGPASHTALHAVSHSLHTLQHAAKKRNNSIPVRLRSAGGAPSPGKTSTLTHSIRSPYAEDEVRQMRQLMEKRWRRMQQSRQQMERMARAQKAQWSNSRASESDADSDCDEDSQSHRDHKQQQQRRQQQQQHQTRPNSSTPSRCHSKPSTLPTSILNCSNPRWAKVLQQRLETKKKLKQRQAKRHNAPAHARTRKVGNMTRMKNPSQSSSASSKSQQRRSQPRSRPVTAKKQRRDALPYSTVPPSFRRRGEWMCEEQGLCFISNGALASCLAGLTTENDTDSAQDVNRSKHGIDRASFPSSSSSSPSILTPHQQDILRAFQHFRRRWFYAHYTDLAESLIPAYGSRVTGIRMVDMTDEALIIRFMQKMSELKCPEPMLTFHGTPKSNHPSILQHGFVLPGTKLTNSDGSTTNVIVRHGSAYGRGIYSNQTAGYCLGYARSASLFVCAVLNHPRLSEPTQRRQRYMWQSMQRSKHEGAVQQKHSPIRMYGKMVVCFDRSRILPLFYLDHEVCKADHLYAARRHGRAPTAAQDRMSAAHMNQLARYARPSKIGVRKQLVRRILNKQHTMTMKDQHATTQALQSTSM